MKEIQLVVAGAFSFPFLSLRVGAAGVGGWERGMFGLGQRHVCFIQFYDKHTVNFGKNCQGLNSGTELI